MPPRHSMRPYRVSLSRSAESRRVFCPCLAGDIKVKTNFAFKIGRPAITGSATYEPDRAPRSRGFAGCRGRTKPNCGTAARERTRSSGSNGTRREGSEVAPRSCRLQEPRRTAQPRYHGFVYCAANPDQHGPMSLTPARFWSTTAAPRAADRSASATRCRSSLLRDRPRYRRANAGSPCYRACRRGQRRPRLLDSAAAIGERRR